MGTAGALAQIGAESETGLVDQIVAGTGVSVSPVGGTGDVTVTNTGVTSATDANANAATGAVKFVGGQGISAVVTPGTGGPVTISNINESIPSSIELGLVGDNATDNTTVLQALINAQKPIGWLPGIYKCGPLTAVPGMFWEGFAPINVTGTTLPAAILSFISATAPHLTIPLGAWDGVIRNMQFEGNSQGQDGIYFTDNTGSGEEAQWVVENVLVEAYQGTEGIYIGQGRRASVWNKVISHTNLGTGWTIKSSDNRLWACTAEFCSANGIHVLADENNFVACNSFNNTDSGLVVDVNCEDTKWFGGSLDSNGQNGATVASGSSLALFGTAFHDNSANATGTFDDIRIAAGGLQSSGFGLRFKAGNTASKSNYNINTGVGTPLFIELGTMLDEASWTTGHMNYQGPGTANFTADPGAEFIPISASAGSITMALHSAHAMASAQLTIVKSDSSANTVTITGALGGSIVLATQGASTIVRSDGANIYKIK